VTSVTCVTNCTSPSPFLSMEGGGRRAGYRGAGFFDTSSEEVLVFADPWVLRVGFAGARKDLARLLQPSVRVQQVRVVAQRCCSPWLHLCVCAF